MSLSKSGKPCFLRVPYRGVSLSKDIIIKYQRKSSVVGQGREKIYDNLCLRRSWTILNNSECDIKIEKCCIKLHETTFTNSQPGNLIPFGAPVVKRKAVLKGQRLNNSFGCRADRCQPVQGSEYRVILH